MFMDGEEESRHTVLVNKIHLHTVDCILVHC